MGGVPVPGVIVILAVVLCPEPADFTVFLEVLWPLFQVVLGEGFSKWTQRKMAEYAIQTKMLFIIPYVLYLPMKALFFNFKH